MALRNQSAPNVAVCRRFRGAATLTAVSVVATETSRFESARRLGGAYPIRTGVNGFAGRRLATRPTRLACRRLPQRHLSSLLAAVTVALCPSPAAATPQPARIQHVAKRVFGPHWRAAACIAHYESTDGHDLYNGPSRGPWQINTAAHPWVNPHRLVTDWVYSARVAFRLSSGGRDWSAWTTHRMCGV